MIAGRQERGAVGERPKPLEESRDLFKGASSTHVAGMNDDIAIRHLADGSVEAVGGAADHEAHLTLET